MYAKSLVAYNFRCFGKAELKLQYPGRTGAGTSDVANVNLILGDNGGGKSSILRALAIAVLAPVLLESGFVAYRLVRRPGAQDSLLKVEARYDQFEKAAAPNSGARRKPKYELLARLEAREGNNRDRLTTEKTPNSPIEQLIFDDYSPAFLVVGYGATRRVETGDFSESSSRRSRGLRYQRVAGLFEDSVAVRPLQSWFQKLDGPRAEEAIGFINAVLPSNICFTGAFDAAEQQYIFEFDGRPEPFNSLSDGYKAFVGMAGDLIGHLADVTPPSNSMVEISGIVLIDEIDLHLHPEWQRTVLPSLANSFPNLQFVCTTHSPLVASTVRKENVFVTDTADDGTAIIKQIEEKLFGQSAEQLLLSSYFGLTTTRPAEFQSQSQLLFAKAAEGDKRAALKFLENMAAPTKRIKAEGSVAALRKKRAKPKARTAGGAA